MLNPKAYFKASKTCQIIVFVVLRDVISFPCVQSMCGLLGAYLLSYSQTNQSFLENTVSSNTSS